MDSKKAIALIIKLNRDTIEGKLTWQTSRVQPSLGNGGIVIDNVYYTEVEKKILRLYKFSQKYYYEEDSFEWTENLRLEFVDFYWKSEFEFPPISILSDLYETVRYKTSGVESFLDSYLGDEEPEEKDTDF